MIKCFYTACASRNGGTRAPLTDVIDIRVSIVLALSVRCC